MTATNLVNDGGSPGTQIIEATVLNDGVSSITLTSDGILTVGSNVRPGTFSIDNGNVASDGAGNLIAVSLTAAKVNTDKNVSLHFGTGNVLGTSANKMLAATAGTWTSAGGPETIAHNFGSAPKLVYIQVRGGISFLTNKEVTAITSTTFTVANVSAGTVYTFIALG